MCKKKLLLLLLLIILVNFSSSQNQCGYDGRKHTYCSHSENNDTIFFFPIIFVVNSKVAEFGNVDFILPLQENGNDTVHCYYSFGRIIPDKIDYLRIRRLPDTTSLTMIFRHQIRNKNKSVNTYFFQWSVLSNRLFEFSPSIYCISFKPNRSLFFTTIYYETAHTGRPFPQKLKKTH